VVVEGEPGIFPDPVARALRAIGRVFSRFGPSTTRDVPADHEDENAAAPQDDA
jgi:hypothetical protein